ncbi:MAG: phosphoribosylformylglycinamidine synthase subunit PurL [Planctomycetes bacterium]|nr:phosphoribosylformylglycinamidine synthase subunit PurL [Planctomycetota bacterium]
MTHSAYLVETVRRDPAHDPAGRALAGELRAAGIAVGAVRLAHVFEVGPTTAAAAEQLGRELFANPVLDRMTVSPASEPLRLAAGERAVTVLRREGVMDPVALSTLQAAEALGVHLERVRAGRRVYVEAEPEVARAACDWVVRWTSNPVVDRALGPEDPWPAAPRPAPALGQLARAVPLAGLDDAALTQLSREACLALDAVEMRAIQAHYAALGRAPTDVELETIAQTWSEHCKHKTLTGPITHEEFDADGAPTARRDYQNLLKQTVFAATQELDLPRCLSVFVDNAGVIRFDDDYGVAIKVETHNHPSAIEPYGGAGTGIGGVIRDILGTGLGARPVLNLDVFCVGDLDAAPESLPKGALHPRTVLRGVVAGVRDYGNRMGIPTACGALVSEPRYAGNPLVFAGTVGLIEHGLVAKQPRDGDWIVAVGGRTGRDGVHGATFSSDALHSASEVESGGAVQIGNPIEEKKLGDVLLEVRDRLSAVTDCGAGGFSSAVGEMAEGLGAEVDLSLAPLKYAGLQPWEVWISEAQERMVLAVGDAHVEAVCAAFAAEDVEAVRLGRFRASGRLVIRWGDETVADLDLDFLHEGLPKQARQARWRAPRAQPFAEPALTPGEALRAILATPTVGSKAPIVRQYDHEVQGSSAIKPFAGVGGGGPSDGVVLAPRLGSRRGIVLGLGLNPGLSDHDPYAMATWAVDEALRNVVAAGADLDSCAILDNFSWGDCRRPEQLGSLVRAAEACRDAALAYRVPFVSGKDSLNNEFELPDGTRAAIPGTLVITALGTIDDVLQAVSMDLKGPGHPLLLVGLSRDELGGGQLAALAGSAGGAVPRVDLERAPGVLRAVQAALATGAVLACHDLSEGGLAVAAAEMGFAGGCGLELDLSQAPREGELGVWGWLFGESPTRFLLEVDPARLDEVRAALASAPHAPVGTTVAEPRLRVRHGADGWLDEPLAELQQAWAGALRLAFPSAQG